MRDISLEKQIIEYIAPNGKIIQQRTLPKILEKRGYLEYLQNLYSEISKKGTKYEMSEIIYRLINHIDDIPTCKICGKSLVFSNRKFPKYCSKKCANSDPDVLKKNAEAVSNAYHSQSEERKQEIKENRKRTLKEKFGIDSYSPFASRQVQDKVKETVKERYGVDNVLCLDSIKKHTREISLERSEKYISKKIGHEVKFIDDKVLIKDCCPIHGDVIIERNFFGNRIKPERMIYAPICPICNSVRSNTSYLEKFVESILSDNNIEFETHNRKILDGKEIDFYIPSLNLAFECNGVFCHSEKFCDKNFHQDKSIKCKEKGIQLIHLWEDDIALNKLLVESTIKAKLGILEKKIYARKCEIRDVNSNDSREFLQDNHIQGNIMSRYRFGLYYNNQLVALMSFGGLRKNLGSNSKEGNYELYRYATLKNAEVVGGASKLFKYALSKLPNVKKVISYAKFDYSNGNLYKKLGFEEIGLTKPNYYWVLKLKRENRFNYRKSIIADDSNNHLSEIEIMHSKGYHRCFDSGNLKYEYNVKSC